MSSKRSSAAVDLSDPPESAARVIRFIETCCHHTKGVWSGKPFLLPDFQKAETIRIFGPVDKAGARAVRTAYLEWPKKSGKSGYAAALALYGLVADGEAGAEVFIAAPSQKQATRIFDVCRKMIRLSPLLERRCKVIQTTKTITLRDDPTAYLRAMASTPDTEDGANPSMVIFDELHRIKDRELFEVLDQGGSTRRQPLMVMITTAGIESESPLCWELHQHAERLLDGSIKSRDFVASIYALGADEDWTKEENWLKVNPACQGPLAFKSIDDIRRLYKKAMEIPSQRSSFRRFQLNQWLSQFERWLDPEHWDRPGNAQAFAAHELEGRRCVGGLDLSAVKDLCCYLLLFPPLAGEADQRLRVLPHFFLPEEGLADRIARDRVSYDLWVDMGLIELTPGEIVDQETVKDRILATGRLYDIAEIATDPWQAVKLSQELEREGFTMTKFTQSARNYNPACKELERLISQERIQHAAHPIMRWCASCTSIKRNAYDEMYPVKPDRAKSPARIDGIVALLMALDRWIRAEAGDDQNLQGFLDNPVIVG